MYKAEQTQERYVPSLISSRHGNSINRKLHGEKSGAQKMLDLTDRSTTL
jgi:hypothetical protein